MAHSSSEFGRVRRRERPGGRRRWTAADKAAYLARFAASPVSMTAFCQAMDVPRATLTLWQREARDTVTARRRSRRPGYLAGFARVALVPPPESPSGADASPTITVVVRGARGDVVKLTGVDAGTALALVRLVLPVER